MTRARDGSAGARYAIGVARVVILDDDVKALAFARQAVRSAGHEPIAVTSAAEAAAVLDAPAPPEILLAAPAADGGEALLLASRVGAGDAPPRTAVLLLGDPGRGAPPLPRVAVPVVAAALVARIAEALASLPARRAAPAGSPEPPRAAATQGDRRGASPPPPPETALRELFRRSAPVGAGMRSTPDSAKDVLGPRPAARQAGRAPIDMAALEELAQSADYFRVLGLPRTATSTEVRDAAARLLAEIDARALSSDAGAPSLDDVRQVVLDARDVLGDEGLRTGYLKGIGADAPETPGGAGPGVANDDRS